MTQAWSGGYVADVAYIEGFYIQQSPVRMAAACLLGGVAAEMPAPDDEACYLELGCGVGIGALLIAASNPAWKVVAVDYNPAHIAIANSLARSARIDNIQFLEADIIELANGGAAAAAIPAADFVSMHGLWSWVSRDVRDGIVRLLGAKTRPGALVHVSYNALPAWQGGMAMQRLIYEAGVRTAGRSDQQAEAGLMMAKDLKAAEAFYLGENVLSRELIDNIHGVSREYLGHEYMNAHWAPAFHADVAAAMAGAKLDYVASGNLLENFPELMMKPEQRAIMDRYSDPVMRELIKDTCLQRALRHDVYVRGARRLRNTERDAAIERLTIAPVIIPSELQTTLHVPVGTAEMSSALKALMEAAMEGPTTIGALRARDPQHSNPAELLSVLVGTNQCQVAPYLGTAQPDSADRLNRVLGDRIKTIVDARSSGLACAPLSTGLTVPPLLQFITARLLNGDSTDNAATWIETLTADVLPDKHDKIREVVQLAIDQRIPVLRQLQIIPG
jgi:SAM-dependent methyltransferase